MLIALGGLGFGVWLFAHFDAVLAEPRQMGATVAQSSPALANELGEPLHFSRFPAAKLHAGGNANMTISVSGPKGSGTLIEWAQENQGRWRICSLVFHPDDARARNVDLVDRDVASCAPE